MSNSNDSEFFKGFLFGGIVGAVVALLYAPKSGKEMREEIRTRASDVKDDAEEKLVLAQKKAEALLEETKKNIEDLRNETEAALAGLKNRSSEIIADGKKTAERQKSRIKDAVEAGVSAYKEEKATKSKKTSS
ncbi:MAG: YtxH domain-containing protein [bacterium]